MNPGPTLLPDGKVVFGNEVGELVAVTPSPFSGAQTWVVDLGLSIENSPAADAAGNIYAGVNGEMGSEGVYTYTPSGSLIWHNSSGDVGQSSGALGADYYVGVYGGLLCLSGSGETQWLYPLTGWVRRAPALATDGTIYVAHADSLHAVTPDGDRLWVVRVDSDIWSSPAVGTDGTVYVGTSLTLTAVDPVLGSIRWAFPTTSTVYSTPAVDANGNILFNSLAGDFYVIDASGSQIDRFHHGKQGHHGITVADDGTIIFTAGDTIYGIASTSGGLATSSWPKFQRDLANTGRK
jgi:hypothetical protein